MLPGVAKHLCGAEHRLHEAERQRRLPCAEEIDDLREFDAREFVDALFESGQGEGDNTSGSYAA